MNLKEKMEIMDKLEELQIEHILAELQNPQSSFMQDRFYKINRDILNKSKEEAMDDTFNLYMESLIEYSESYYEQLLVNIGKDYKLLAYDVIKRNYDNPYPIMEQIIADTRVKIDVLMSKPILSLYHDTIDSGKLDDTPYKILIMILKNTIASLLEGIYELIKVLIKSGNSIEAYNRYTNDLYWMLNIGLLEGIFGMDIECGHTYIDMVASKYPDISEEDIKDYYNLINNILFCIGSPGNDPLVIYYNK